MSIKDDLKNDNMSYTSLMNKNLEDKMNSLFDFDRENREDRTGMHGSGIIASDDAFCYREQVLSFYFKQFEKQIPPSLKRIFLEGWSIHEKWQMLFKKSGIAYGIEQRGYSESWQLLFTPDAIVKINGKKYIVEIKSVNTYQFKNMKSHPSAEKQLQLYMHFCGIPRGFVLCEDKNIQEIKCFYYEYDPQKAAPFVDRMLKVIKYKERYEKTGKLPKRKCNNENCKRAQSCNYYDACFEKQIPLDKEKFNEMRNNWE